MTVEPMMGVVTGKASAATLHHLAKLAKAAGQPRAARELVKATRRYAERPRFELTSSEAVALDRTLDQCPTCLPPQLHGLVRQLAVEARATHAREMARPRPGNRPKVGTCASCGGPLVMNRSTRRATCPCGKAEIPTSFIEQGRRLGDG